MSIYIKGIKLIRVNDNVYDLFYKYKRDDKYVRLRLIYKYGFVYVMTVYYYEDEYDIINVFYNSLIFHPLHN